MQLHAGDLDATMKFYEKHFGLKKTRYPRHPRGAPCPAACKLSQAVPVKEVADVLSCDSRACPGHPAPCLDPEIDAKTMAMP